MAFALSVGTDIKGISIGVINDENVNNICNNISDIKTAIPYSFSSCNLTAISCRFVKELDDPMLNKVRVNFYVFFFFGNQFINKRLMVIVFRKFTIR